MDNFHLLNDDAKNYFFSRKHLAVRAEKWVLKDYLSIKQISILLFPIDKKLNTKKYRHRKKDILDVRRSYKRQLIKTCEKGGLKYEGDITGWQFDKDNPYPKATKGRIEKVSEKETIHVCLPHCCTIHKDEFKRYLENDNNWPIDSLLANWWLDESERIQLTNKPAIKNEQYLIPQQRETNTFTDLVYQICKGRNIKKLSTLKGKDAWSLIITRQFTSPLIKDIDESNKFFILKEDNKKIDKTDFLERYRSRFSKKIQ